MKNLKMLLVATLLSFVASAQSKSGAFKQTTYTTVSTDTVIDTGTKYLVASPAASVGYAYCSASIKTANISGSSSVTVTLEHSADGTNWYSVPTDSVLVITGAGVKGLLWTGYRDYAIRLKCVGSGTQHTQISGAYSIKN